MCLALVVFSCRSSWSEENAIPQAFPTDRYAAMRKHCPFAISTGAPAPTPPQPSFAANWFVSGIARIDESDFVTIKARDQSAQFSLYGHEPNPQNQVALVSIDWVDGVGKSSVTVRKGSETAKLEFNEAVVHGPAQGAAAQGGNNNGKVIAPMPCGVAKPGLPIGGLNPPQQQRAVPASTPPIIRNRILPQQPMHQGPGR